MTDIEKLTEKNKRLQETILAYSARVNMYELKVGRLRRTIGEYIDKYGFSTLNHMDSKRFSFFNSANACYF